MRRHELKEKWKTIPETLRKQIVVRLGVGLVALMLFVVILITYRDIYMALPCIILSVFLIAAAGWLAYSIARGDYICITGTCTQVQLTAVRKRIKQLQLDVDGIPVQLQIKHRMKVLSVGDVVTMYLSEKTPVYEKDGVQLICSYIAVERGKGADRDERIQGTGSACNKAEGND